ncbi:MAG: TonB-dependent receptor [Saprospiraceae bacterium]|nr:TonB-dependent receptor [Saprospiraceae bacterium]
MNRIKFWIFVAFWVLSHGISAQEHRLYNIRGTVKDQVTQQPLIGALIYVINYENQSTISNENGDFHIEDLPLGRHSLQVTYLGYISYLSNIEVKSGKELVLNINLKEELHALDEVVITARAEKSKPVNSLSYASTRTFSVEESSKFASAVDDPARMAQSFAGVIPTDDGNNYVSIRGNHPSALLYRIEGIDIPNPNHFGDVASSGGGVSVLSSQMMANSDFSTGAFSAEYGNALGGIFDLKLRKGNNNKTEYTLKAGFLGLEAAIEGPFSKNYKGSYLINYRYSTLSLIDKLGVDLSGVINYRDLSYNINLPLNKGGNFSLFGLNGWSDQGINETIEDLDADKGAIDHRFDGKFLSNMSVNGVKYTVSPSKNSFMSAIFAYSTTKNGYQEDVNTIYRDFTYFSKFNFDNKLNKLSGALSFTQKIKANLVLKSGFYYDNLGYQTTYNEYANATDYTNLINNADNTSYLRAFAQMQYQINDKWSSNFGFHYASFLLNNKQVLEPRGNIQYTFNQKSNIALAYGRHSQLQPLVVYFLKGEDDSFVNKDLDFTKAHHVVLTYNYDVNSHTHIKSELYYQHLTNVAVGVGENRNFAMLNQQFFIPNFVLVNEGKGKNMGIELTLERFLHNNWYYIVTASVSDAKYKTPSTAWLNTRYNAQYSSVMTIGKEWVVGKSKRNTLGINIKTAIVGGQWDTPIDRIASQLAKEEIRDEGNPFTIKLKDYYKLDIGIKYKRNKQNYTSTLSLDLMNATNNRNIGGITYDIQNDKMNEWTMMPFVPVLAYKVEF